jgi:hypothetical protein
VYDGQWGRALAFVKEDAEDGTNCLAEKYYKTCNSIGEMNHDPKLKL